MPFILGFLFPFALAGCLTATDPPADAPPPAGMARVVVTRSDSARLIGTPARIELNGAQVAELPITDSTSSSVAPGNVVVSVSAASPPGRYSYLFKAEPVRIYRFIVAPRDNITAAGLAAGPGQAIEASGPFGIAATDQTLHATLPGCRTFPVAFPDIPWDDGGHKRRPNFRGSKAQWNSEFSSRPIPTLRPSPTRTATYTRA